MSAANIAFQYAKAGYRVVSLNNRRIARIDREDWLTHLGRKKVESCSTLDTTYKNVHTLADIYRANISKDRISNVFKSVYTELTKYDNNVGYETKPEWLPQISPRPKTSNVYLKRMVEAEVTKQLAGIVTAPKSLEAPKSSEAPKPTEVLKFKDLPFGAKFIHNVPLGLYKLYGKEYIKAKRYVGTKGDYQAFGFDIESGVLTIIGFSDPVVLVS